MKKLIAFFSGLLLTFVFVTTVSAAENWDVRGTYTLALTCTSGCGGTWNHSMNITVENMDTGVFSGTGYFISNPAYTWSVSGTVDGNIIDFDVDYTGLNPSYYVDVAGTIATNGSMSGTATAPGQTFNWTTTSGYAKFNRRAEITSPAPDSIVTNTLNLGAYLMDNDYDPVQWAVRKGTCAAATNTVMGNVDGHSDFYNWAVDVGDPYKYNFSASADVTTWLEGEYCFIFNPSEDGGESDIRMTEFFKVNWDEDNDGLLSGDDCDDRDSSVAVTVDSKACILYQSGVPGEGILNAPGLQKPFNPNSKASENAGKK